MRWRVRWPWRKPTPLRRPGDLWPGIREALDREPTPFPTSLAPPATDEVIIPVSGVGLAPVAHMETPEE